MTTSPTTTITVLHRTDRGRMSAIWLGEAEYTEAYSYETSPSGTPLEQIWRDNNRVDGSPNEMVPDGFRSLCTGDLVRIGDSPEVHLVMMVGWATFDTMADFTAEQANDTFANHRERNSA